MEFSSYHHICSDDELNTAALVQSFSDAFGVGYQRHLIEACEKDLKPIHFHGGSHYSKSEVEAYLRVHSSKANIEDKEIEKKKFWDRFSEMTGVKSEDFN